MITSLVLIIFYLTVNCFISVYFSIRIDCVEQRGKTINESRIRRRDFQESKNSVGKFFIVLFLL